MKFSIEVRVAMVCPECLKNRTTFGHGTTVTECVKSMGRPCDYPWEHHKKRRHRPHLAIAISR